MNQTTPHDIVVRRPDFSFEGADPAWFANNIVLSCYLNLLSASFPIVEPMFIKAVRARRDQITDPALKADVAGFIGQEAQHSKQHLAMNRWLKAQGHPMDETTAVFQRVFKRITNRCNEDELLAMVSGFEHLTAMVSAFVLRHPAMQGDQNDTTALIQWHCIEEIEHKSVCFDVYQACVGDLWVRRRATLSTLFGFSIVSIRTLLLQLWDRKVPVPDAWAAAKFIVPLWASMVWSSADSLRANFHPDESDESSLLESWRQRYPELAAGA
jgi:uncharacterized protein